MMLKLDLKLYILFLLGLAIVNQNYIESTKLKLGQETPNINMDLDKLKELEKTEVEDESKKPSEQENLVKSLSSINTDDLTQVKLEDLKDIENEDKSKFEGQSCENIKKLGQQKNYCESKFLLSQGEEKTVECMKSFCPVCCQDDLDCQEKCRKTHAFFTDHDPEDMFISVCSYKDMGPSFEGFCKSMLTESDPSEYNQCITNFCFDCCSNELKINDFNDPEMVKCLGVCKPPEKVEDPSPVPGTLAPPQKEDLPNEMLLENKILELNNKPDSVEETLKNEPPQVQEKNTIIEDTDNYNVLADFSKGKKDDKLIDQNQKSTSEEKSQFDFKKNNKSAMIENSQDKTFKEDSSKEGKSLITSINSNSETKENADNGEKISSKIISKDIILNKKHHSVDEFEESKLSKLSKLSKDAKKHSSHSSSNHYNSISNQMKLKELNKFTEITERESKDFADDKSSKKLENLKYTPEERNRQNIKICENLILTFTNIKNFGSNINKHCKNNYFTNLFESYHECLENLCSQCCTFLDEKKEIAKCSEQCNKTEKKMPIQINVETPKIEKNLLENNPIKKLELIHDNTLDLSLVHFELIKSICKARYFKDCHETLCEEYCNLTMMPKCTTVCTQSVGKESPYQMSFDNIMKKHGFYEAKYEILYQRSREEKLNKYQTEGRPGLEINILQSKNKIENLKKQLLSEEKNLLNLYNRKNS